MKKTVLTVFAALLSLCACNRATTSDEVIKTYALDRLQFNFTIERESSTKGVRSGWLSGDKVFVFIGGVNSAYLTVTYDGSAWSTDPQLPAGMSLPVDLPESGTLTAVYLPYGNDRTASWDGSAWVFSGTNDYYYMQSQKAAYSITDMGDKLATMGAYLYMETAKDYIQFYLPDDEASGSIQLACNYLIPSQIAGVSLDGTVSDTSPAPGSWITARADTIDGDKGYYASGKLLVRSGLHLYLAMNASGSYKHFYKQRGAALSPHGAYILPSSEDWLAVSPSTMIEVAGAWWYTTNAGADSPWETGTAYTSSQIDSPIAAKTLVPSDSDWSTLLDRTKAAWIQISIAGTDGFLIVDREDAGKYFFLSCNNYWSTTSTGGNRHYLKSLSDGTHELAESASPASAYVRLLSTQYTSSINPPENGGNI